MNSMDSGLASIIGGMIAAIVGGVIAGLMTAEASSKATKEALENTLRLQKQEHDQAIRGVILGLRTEIDVIKQIYESEFATGEIKSLEAGKPFEYQYPIHQNYFTIYESNASLIGQIPDDELRVFIIQIYLRIKGLIDVHLYNNSLLTERDRLAIVNFHENNIDFITNQNSAQKAVDDYGINIKVNYEQLIELLEKFYPKADAVIQILSDSRLVKEMSS